MELAGAAAARGILTGVWVDRPGVVHLAVAGADGTRREERTSWEPFAWLSGQPAGAAGAGVRVSALQGEGPFGFLAQGGDLAAFERFLRQARDEVTVDLIRPFENQFLLQQRERLYRDLPFPGLRRCQLSLAVAPGEDGPADATRPADAVLAIALHCGPQRLLLRRAADSPAGEKQLLEEFGATLRALDPDVIEGHNLFKFDLDYLRQRCRLHRIPLLWGRFGQAATFRSGRFKVAERFLEFPRCDLPGRAVIDTLLLAQAHDITRREMTGYTLPAVAVALGITPESDGERTWPGGGGIAAPGPAGDDLPRFLDENLREIRGIADQLLPTYFEQTRTFPILLQDATLRGATAKIDLLFLEEYYHARQACPVPPEIAPFEGGFTKSYHTGVFRHVLHFDVASLYPSLLLQIGRHPRNDSLEIFLPLLRSLREYRLKFKQLARTAPTESERAEAQARQTSFKILINSFYGYLGFSGARFADGELAAEVTRRGRELLQALIAEFARHGATILEADTDGIYLSSETYFEDPDALLALVRPSLPAGIELEFDGKYPAMWCYKAKNYALYDGATVTLRGGALRSRGMEPYLRRLGHALIHFLLGASAESPAVLLASYRAGLAARTIPVEDLAKSETLGQNADSYERWVAGGGKPRRAALEAALQLKPRPRLGDRVAYYVTEQAGGRTSDWQRARPVQLHDPAAAPYDPRYYSDKLDDWLDRYGSFFGVTPEGVQGELL